MANQSGQVYGLTILSPIIEDNRLDICHSMELRWYLGHLPRDYRSPFARISSTYLARLVVMDDVVYVGTPANEEHLKSRYLVFETNFDGDLDSYLKLMARETPEFVDAVWKHCVGYPGLSDITAFVAYMKKCQVATTFYFADVNNRTVRTTLKALQTQSALARFIEKHQGQSPVEIQRALRTLIQDLANAPLPLPGGDESDRMPQEDRVHD
jgi:hypothetical protein